MRTAWLVIRRTLLILVGTVCAGIVWLGYSIGAEFENWPWTVNHTYRSGEFGGIAVPSTRQQVLDRILAGQSAGRFGKIALIDDEGIEVVQDDAAHAIRAGMSDRLGRASVWVFDTEICECQFELDSKCTCNVRLYFKGEELTKLVHSEYSGPRI